MMILEFIKTDTFSLIMAGTTAIMLTSIIILYLKLRKLNKNYNAFMKKLGKGDNIDEMLKKYIQKVEQVESKNGELEAYCHRLDKDMTTCLQKIGMVRYSAFKDTGSDLSFALALLDDNNNGVILNGIYSREMSNIYAKQVIKGETSSKISEEEKEALYIAMNQVKEYKIKE